MIMFAILFGLSMDYEVFLLSRVREEFVRTGDSHTSVVDGLSSTARVITCAALIMISVFGAFILGDNVTIKMFGVGLSVAVLLDATLVRLVLVPATDEPPRLGELVAPPLARPPPAQPRLRGWRLCRAAIEALARSRTCGRCRVTTRSLMTAKREEVRHV